jgi:hypothetical protein
LARKDNQPGQVDVCACDAIRRSNGEWEESEIAQDGRDPVYLCGKWHINL